MIDSILSNEFWLQLMRFISGSTILLLVVYLLDSSRWVQSYRLRSGLWKTAILCCVLLLLPIENPLAPSYRFEANPAARPGSPLPEVLVSEVPVSEEIQAAAALPIMLPTQGLNESASPLLASPYSQVSEFSNAAPAPSLIAIAIQAAAGLGMVTWLIIGWLGISLLLMTRHVAGFFAGLRQLGYRQAITAEDARYKAMLSLCQTMGVHPSPRLSQSSQIASPVTLPGNEICLPEWTEHSLPENELQGLLAHELAHIKNRDLLTLLGLQLLSSLFFFQPLFLLARRRLQDISEFLADESASHQCGNKNVVASVLLSCAEKVQRHRPLQWGFAMVGDTSRLKQRVEKLQQENSISAEKESPANFLAIAGVFCLFILAVPSFKYGFAEEAPKTSLPTAHVLEQQTVQLDLQQLQQQLRQKVDQLNSQNGNMQQIAQLNLQQLEKISEQLSRQQIVQTEVQNLKQQVEQLDLENLKHELEQQIEQVNLQKAEIELQTEQINAQGDEIYRQAEEMVQQQQILLAQVSAEAITQTRTAESNSIFSSLFSLLGSDSNSYNSNGDDHQWRWREGSADWHGDFTTNPNEDGIVAITDDGYFDYQSRRTSTERRIRYEAEGGQLTQTYWLRGEETELDADGRAWLNEVLLRLMRRTGASAEPRVDRMLAENGPDAVIEELRFIESDFVSRLYSELLLSKSSLNETEISRLLEAHSSISSDMESRLLLSHLSATQSISDENLRQLVAAAKAISSDMEKRLLISQLVENLDVSDYTTAQLLAATADISSDMEMRLALRNIISQGLMNAEENWPLLLAATRSISSDMELRLLLSDGIEVAGDSAYAALFLIQATSTISSDMEMRLALSTILNRGRIDTAGWEEALGIIDQQMSSSREKASLLRAIADRVPNDEDLRTLYNEAAMGVQSSAERSRLTLL